MERTQRLNYFLTEVNTIDNKVIEESIEHGLEDLELLSQCGKEATFSVTETIPKCKDVLQLEIILKLKRHRLRRRHNALLSTLENEEFVDYLVHHPVSSLNPGYKSSLPLLHASMNHNVDRVRTFLLSMRCNIHATPSDSEYTILQHVLADGYLPIIELFALVYRDSCVYDDKVRAEIRQKMRTVRDKMCIKQANAKMSLLKIMQTNRGRYSKQGILDIAIFTDLPSQICNNKLCKRLHMRTTKLFIDNNFLN